MNEDKMVLSEYARLRTINSLASHLSCSFPTKVLKLIYKCEDFVQEKHKTSLLRIGLSHSLRFRMCGLATICSMHMI